MSKSVGGVDYGPTCNARFALPVQVCALPPGHDGEHSEHVLRALEVLQRAVDGGRHGIGCATLRFPAGACDCWVRVARELLGASR